MTIEIERASVLTIDIPESFNMFYWQDTDCIRKQPTIYLHIYKKIFRLA